MDTKFSPRVHDIMTYAYKEAERLRNSYIGIEHLFLGMLKEGKSNAIAILRRMNLNIEVFQKKLEASVKSAGSNLITNSELQYTKQAERVLKFTYIIAKEFHSDMVHSEQLMLAMLHEKNNIISQNLEFEGITYDDFKAELMRFLSENGLSLASESYLAEYENMQQAAEPQGSVYNNDDDDDDEDEGSTLFSPRQSRPAEQSKSRQKSKTPVLDSFGSDLTLAAEENRLDPIVGREKEIERIAQILSRRKKNNPILIGEPGVGKSALAEGLAIRIAQHKVPRTLYEKRIVMLDMTSVVAGTKYRGQFEERMKAIINELAKNPQIIVFLDEIHNIVGAGNPNGSLDAGNILKPALARGEIQCIGSTTLDEYRQYIEKDGALERRFQKVLVNPTTPEETIQILNNIKPKYEDHHGVCYDDKAIEACVTLTTRYMSERCLPDKAIDAMDEAGARVRIKNIEVPQAIVDLEKEIEDVRKMKKSAVKEQRFEDAQTYRNSELKLITLLDKEKSDWESNSAGNRLTVTEQDVADVVAVMTGVPVQRVAKDETERLLHMEEELAGSVVGQDDAIKKISKAIRRNRAGLKDPNRPIGSFMFLGPTGVGKTYLAKVLAKYLFDSEDALIRIDMSEYMEKFAVSRLVGAPPGYVGYEEGGQLTEKVRRHPYSIVLLDEMEKAHPDVFNMMLQVLDDGILTDSNGRKVDFKNCIIIMTSNTGSRQLKDFGQGVGFGTEARRNAKNEISQGVIENALKRTFAPEFLNRIDEIVIFNSLQRNDINSIIDIELKGIKQRLTEQGCTLELTDEAKNFIADKGWDEQFGARPLKRAVQKYVEDKLAEEIMLKGMASKALIDINEEKDDVIVKMIDDKPLLDEKITEPQLTADS